MRLVIHRSTRARQPVNRGKKGEKGLKQVISKSLKNFVSYSSKLFPPFPDTTKEKEKYSFGHRKRHSPKYFCHVCASHELATMLSLSSLRRRVFLPAVVPLNDIPVCEYGPDADILHGERK